jgi:erythromycin esterase-like protein
MRVKDDHDLVNAIRRSAQPLTGKSTDEITLLLREPRLERGIGVIYQPRSERVSYYFHAQLADQFDAILHFDETRAVEPLERTTDWDTGEVPTYPSVL